MKISRHIRSASADFVCRVTAASDTPFDAKPFDCESGAAHRKTIYKTLIKIDYGEDLDNALSGVLTARGLSRPDELVPVLHTNFSLLPRHFPPHLRCSQFELITNCLFDSRRFRKIDGQDTSPCFLCGRGSDTIAHLYGGDCEVVVVCSEVTEGVWCEVTVCACRAGACCELASFVKAAIMATSCCVGLMFTILLRLASSFFSVSPTQLTH